MFTPIPNYCESKLECPSSIYRKVPFCILEIWWHHWHIIECHYRT